MNKSSLTPETIFAMFLIPSTERTEAPPNL